MYSGKIAVPPGGAGIREIQKKLSTMASMEFRAAIYMSFKKTQCSLRFIVINVIIINFDGTSK
jgi:hypothetical protein